MGNKAIKAGPLVAGYLRLGELLKNNPDFLARWNYSADDLRAEAAERAKNLSADIGRQATAKTEAKNATLKLTARTRDDYAYFSTTITMLRGLAGNTSALAKQLTNLRKDVLARRRQPKAK